MESFIQLRKGRTLRRLHRTDRERLPAQRPAAHPPQIDVHDRVDWSVIAIDTRRRLVPSAEILADDLGQHS